YRNAYGSVRSSLTQAIMISNITTANGTAVIMTRYSSPSKVVSSPSNSITMAIPPITSPQNITISFGGSCRPRMVRIPMTTEADSAAATKKIANRTMISNGNHSAYGRLSTRVNSTCGAAVSSGNAGWPSRYIQIEE